LDDAQAGINHLQVLLNRFHTELTDVQVSREMTAEIDGFLRFGLVLRRAVCGLGRSFPH
jgi:hypothetical protein